MQEELKQTEDEAWENWESVKLHVTRANDLISKLRGVREMVEKAQCAERCASRRDDIYSRCVACQEGRCRQVHPNHPCDCIKRDVLALIDAALETKGRTAAEVLGWLNPAAGYTTQKERDRAAELAAPQTQTEEK